MSAHITCDVDPSLHRFDLAVVSLRDPSLIDVEVVAGAYFNAPEGEREEWLAEEAFSEACDRFEVGQDEVSEALLNTGRYNGPLVVYERCALSEIVVDRSISKVLPSAVLYRGATFPRYGKHFSPRRWLASLDPETDVLVLTGAKSFERVPADRVVVLAHHVPEV